MRNKLFVSLVLGAALATAMPAMADRGHHKHKRHHHGHHVVYHETRYVPARTVVHYRPARVYYHAPRPVYVVEHHDHHHSDAAKWIGGAILVGAILHHVDHHR